MKRMRNELLVTVLAIIVISFALSILIKPMCVKVTGGNTSVRLSVNVPPTSVSLNIIINNMTYSVGAPIFGGDVNVLVKFNKNVTTHNKIRVVLNTLLNKVQLPFCKYTYTFNVTRVETKTLKEANVTKTVLLTTTSTKLITKTVTKTVTVTITKTEKCNEVVTIEDGTTIIG